MSVLPVEKGGAPEWAMQRAQALVTDGETIQAVWTISDENGSNAVKQPLACLACPCFWVHALICSPCIVAYYYSTKAALRTMVYVLTDKRLYRARARLDPPSQEPLSPLPPP